MTDSDEVVLAESSIDRFKYIVRDTMRGVLNEKQEPKTETPPPTAPTPPPATVADKLSGFSDEEIAEVADAVYERVEERKAGKTPEPTTVTEALKQGMKENVRQALSIYFAEAGKQQRARDEAKREQAEAE